MSVPDTMIQSCVSVLSDLRREVSGFMNINECAALVG